VAIAPAIRDATPDCAPEYRHLRAFGVTRIAGGMVAAAVCSASVKVAQTGPGEGSVADAMSEPLRLTIVYEDAGDGDGWVVARIPQVRGAISQGATRRVGARKRDRRAPRAARGPVRFAARAARPHRQRLARADDRGLKSMTGESRPVAGRR
jgi:hypothetical protein